MLQQNLNGKAVYVKFLNGEEVFAKQVSEDDKTLTLSKPRVLVPVDQNSAQLMPYILFAADKSVDETNLSFNKDHVLVKTELKGPIEKNYTNATSTIKPATNVDLQNLTGN